MKSIPDGWAVLLTLFDHVADGLLKEPESRASQLDIEGHLWRLPRHVVHSYRNVITDEDRAQARPLVQKLRSRAVKLINERPEHALVREKLAERVQSARREFSFRSWRLDDVERFVSYLNNEAMWTYIPEDYPAPLTPELAEVLIRHSNEAPERHEVCAVEWQGEVVGQVRLQFDSSPTPDSAEISYWLAQPFWNKGLTTDFVTLYTSISFQSHPAIDRIFAHVLVGNDSSIRVLEKSGYRQESFEYHNLLKHGKKVSTYVLSVFRWDYQVE